MRYPPQPTSAVELKDLKPGGKLDGPFVSTKATPNRVTRANRQFNFTRSDRPFKEVMVYFHIDAWRNATSRSSASTRSQPADRGPHRRPTPTTSHYSPTTKSLVFGTGGVDDAEDAEIILHDMATPFRTIRFRYGAPRTKPGAMGEGFGDYFAGSFFAESKPQPLDPQSATGDAVAYSGAEPPLAPCGQQQEGPQGRYQRGPRRRRNLVGRLWELRGLLGRRGSDRLVLAHHFLLKKDASFEDAAKALILADANLNHGKNEAAIRAIFVRPGILPNPKRRNRRAGAKFDDVAPHGRRPVVRERRGGRR